jgi:hypothetical protein
MEAGAEAFFEEEGPKSKEHPERRRRLAKRIPAGRVRRLRIMAALLI